MSFAALGLAEPLLKALIEEGYQTPTPIQTQAIPPALLGRDVLGCAQTGTGKTAAFALPILHRLAAQARPRRPRRPQVLVLTPTRELALQIDTSFRAYGRHLKLTYAVIFGGVGQASQVQALSGGLDVLTATPGRLLDLMGQGHIELDALHTFVLDEADRMLDMGFFPDVKKIMAKLPSQRHTMFFSATLEPEVVSLARKLVVDPVHVQVTPSATTVERITQRVVFVDSNGKRDLLHDLLTDKRVKRALVFTRTKHGANRVVERLGKQGIKALALHGNKSQNARQRALAEFRDGSTPVLVATDIAARGLDIDEVTHVVNYELPNEPESYVHRIGRTARAGASGLAISLCDREEIAYLRDIEQLIGERITVAADKIGLPPRILDPGPVGRKGARPSGHAQR